MDANLDNCLAAYKQLKTKIIVCPFLPETSKAIDASFDTNPDSAAHILIIKVLPKSPIQINKICSETFYMC